MQIFAGASYLKWMNFSDMPHSSYWFSWTTEWILTLSFRRKLQLVIYRIFFFFTWKMETILNEKFNLNVLGKNKRIEKLPQNVYKLFLPTSHPKQEVLSNFRKCDRTHLRWMFFIIFKNYYKNYLTISEDLGAKCNCRA